MHDKKAPPVNRTYTRIAAVNALYSCEIHGKSQPWEKTINEVLILHRQLKKELGMKAVYGEFFTQLVCGVKEHIAHIDQLIIKHLHHSWKIERLALVTKAILRLAVYEIFYQTTTPLKVIINEYVKISALFFIDEDIGFINGVLDKIAHHVRDKSE